MTAAVAVSLRTDVRWRVRDCDAIRHGLCDYVMQHSSCIGPITGDDLLRFFTVSETAGMLG